jgi:opacity protein-like surface antigen
MKQVLAAVLAALAVASVALAADPPVKVAVSGANVVISGSAPDVKGNVVAMALFKNNVTAGIGRYAPPTKANGYAWKMTVPKSYMTPGKYMVQLVDIVPGQSAPHYIKFTFTY